jgi:hypothetical protein
MRLPTVTKSRVYHWGTLDVRQQGRHGASLEGDCLSVSRCPRAWRDIAQLGGLTLFELAHGQGIFLDMLSLYADAPLRQDVVAWGLAQGYVTQEVRYRAWFFDEEAEGWCFFLCASIEEAFREADTLGEYPSPEALPGPHGPGTGVEPVEAFIATSALAARMGLTLRGSDNAFDYVAIAWAEDTQPQLQGAWWQDEYAPLQLSAPRGGIFKSRVSAWRSQEVVLTSAPEERA